MIYHAVSVRKVYLKVKHGVTEEMNEYDAYT